MAGVNITAGRVAWSDSSNGFRLPTEAEWEYACRAGTATAFHGGEIAEVQCEPVDPSLDRVGRYCGNSWNNQGVPRRQTWPARSRLRNAFGLYDMHGNVEEWCWDWYGDYPAGPVVDLAGRRPATIGRRAVAIWRIVARRPDADSPRAPPACWASVWRDRCRRKIFTRPDSARLTPTPSAPL